MFLSFKYYGYLLASTLYFILLFIDAESSDIVITILSQNNDYSLSKANKLKKSILNQSKLYGNSRLRKVQLLHEQYPEIGSWTIIPIVELLLKENRNVSWFLFCEENSFVNYENLLKLLQNYKYNEYIWMGYGLKDKNPTIIHHYEFENDINRRLAYPLFASGFIMSVELLLSILDKKLNTVGSHFAIDASYELAQQIDQKLEHLPLKFCLKPSSDCVVHPQTERHKCDHKVTKDSIYFAVKTCKKYHDDRIPVLKSTWGRDAVHIEFFSDTTELSIPTTVLPNIPNTEQGHCLKTISIIKHLSKKLSLDHRVKWLVLTDDDTLISVPRLTSILNCWNGQEIALGQRYGYNVRRNLPLGYNYITGGGGIVLNIDVVHKLKDCKCYAPDAPDDMVLGICLQSLNISIVHSPVFHQARPQDYADEYLEAYPIISFHKHLQIDPIQIYRYWLYQDSSFGHDEL
ncbi:beta-1,3-glucosyltransferase [Daktulosphaira vitifoliae]|uniref:beta-1,3-glucosyltransferase n=1 Tax=Daktulosphaira vitifoliae TaxID=58002 RepID=UPI0021A9F79E|nr:beta-1,3-glucosyltransferase [Daktulosphaira vitifoliae]